MVGIVIDGRNTLEEFGLILGAEVSIGSPTVKTQYVDVPGSNGTLDFTESIGGLCYNNREIAFQLIALSDVTAKRSAVMNAFHGKRVKVWFPDDSTHYYSGRLSIGDSTQNGMIPATLEAFPFKLKNTPTVKTFGSGSHIIENESMKAVPKVRTTASCAVTVNGREVNLGEGSFIIPQFVLHSGENTLTISGNANVTFEWQEGGF